MSICAVGYLYYDHVTSLQRQITQLNLRMERLEKKNELLEKTNDDLRDQIIEIYAELKSVVPKKKDSKSKP